MVRTGPSQDQTYRGVLKAKFANGDFTVEVEPGIFKTFKAEEAVLTPLSTGDVKPPAP